MNEEIMKAFEAFLEMKHTSFEKTEAKKFANRNYARNNIDEIIAYGFYAGYKTANRWISVKEREPDIDDYFDAWVPDRRITSCRIGAIHINDKNKTQTVDMHTEKVIYSYDLRVTFAITDITHWMPIPEGPNASA